MKKIYQNVEVEVLLLWRTDIITLSSGAETDLENFYDDTADDIFVPNG